MGWVGGEGGGGGFVRRVRKAGSEAASRAGPATRRQDMRRGGQARWCGYGSCGEGCRWGGGGVLVVERR